MTSEDRPRSVEVGSYLSLERRGAPRLAEPFPALVRSRRCGARSFEEESLLDNLSAYGLHVRLSHAPAVGDPLFVIVRFTLGALLRAPGPGVAAHGIVLRSMRQSDGRQAIALLFIRHRLLFAAPATP